MVRSFPGFISYDLVEDLVAIACCIFCCPCVAVYYLLPDRWSHPSFYESPEETERKALKKALKKRNKLKRIRKKEDEALRRKFRRDERSFRHLELPVELRKRIYELVLVHPGFYRPISTKFADRSERDSRSILFTCKGVYEEAYVIFFSKNRFALASAGPRPVPYRIQVQDFLRTIGVINASLIRHVRLEGFPWRYCSYKPQVSDLRRISCVANLIEPLEVFKGGLESLQIHMARRASCDLTCAGTLHTFESLHLVKSDVEKRPYIRSFSIWFSRDPDCRFDEQSRTSMAACGWIIQQADEVDDDTHTTRTSIIDFFRLERDEHPVKDSGCIGKTHRHPWYI
ncbi:hypothetical protein CCHR01_18761 [Colletotrichum chrysophilum]|uniref:F-box domain-containing protein n=1 Tax=Colletotrichum chrysophilum TaxID=1836956 RepID=A0AAD9A1U5_9PEZI|nr:hypothetical protein CCHR01_18761 [Colletotrichum chrysophilum]